MFTIADNPMPVIKFLPVGETPSLLKYVVIAARYQGQWILVRHNQRTTWEIPGGHIESGELPDCAASRELMEETGAAEFSISPLTGYSVVKDGEVTSGIIYFAEVSRIGELPDFEIAEIKLVDSLPENLTYPLIQPIIFDALPGFLQPNLNDSGEAENRSA